MADLAEKAEAGDSTADLLVEETEKGPSIYEDPLAEPTESVGFVFVTILALTNLGIWTAFFTPIQFLLPLQVEGMVGSGAKENNLTVVLTAGALVSLFVGPIAGAFSDRTTSKMGRRRPWVLWPTIGAVIVMVVAPFSPAIWALTICWALAQLTLNSSYGAVTAMLPDQVPVRQRGTVSAIVGACQPLGVMVGAALIAFIPQTGTEEGSDAVGGQETRYFAVAGILAVTSALFVLFIREARLDPSRVDKLQWLEFIKSFWIDPRKYPDFAWVWITRFLVITGNAFVTTYLLFFTRDVLKLSPTEADTTVASTLVYYTAALLVCALITGPLSDKTGKILIFVFGASLVMAVALVILAFANTTMMLTIAAVVMGAGFGAYTAVDLAMISLVLPRPEDRAKDLGVVNIANALPQVLAPVIAGLIVSTLKSQGYDLAYKVLYLSGAVVTVLGAALLWKIKSVP